MKTIYLDNNATTALIPEVMAAVDETMLAAYGNPSSAHSAGESARVKIEEARQALADLVGADSEQLVFTSGGTEANNMVLRSAVYGRERDSSIVTTTVEHSSILKMCEHLQGNGVASKTS